MIKTMENVNFKMIENNLKSLKNKMNKNATNATKLIDLYIKYNNYLNTLNVMLDSYEIEEIKIRGEIVYYINKLEKLLNECKSLVYNNLHNKRSQIINNKNKFYEFKNLKKYELTRVKTKEKKLFGKVIDIKTTTIVDEKNLKLVLVKYLLDNKIYNEVSDYLEALSYCFTEIDLELKEKESLLLPDSYIGDLNKLNCSYGRFTNILLNNDFSDLLKEKEEKIIVSNKNDEEDNWLEKYYTEDVINESSESTFKACDEIKNLCKINDINDIDFALKLMGFYYNTQNCKEDLINEYKNKQNYLNVIESVEHYRNLVLCGQY